MKHFPEGIHWRQWLFFFPLQTVTSNLFLKVSTPRVGELGIIRLLPQSCSLLFSKLLLPFVDYIGQTWLGSVASGWMGSSVALAGNQKAGEWSGWGIHLASPVLEGVHPPPEPALLGSSLPPHLRLVAALWLIDPRRLHYPCGVLLTLPRPANKLFMNISLGNLAVALTDPVTIYLISF